MWLNKHQPSERGGEILIHVYFYTDIQFNKGSIYAVATDYT